MARSFWASSAENPKWVSETADDRKIALTYECDTDLRRKEIDAISHRNAIT